jgi:hypothetical protein
VVDINGDGLLDIYVCNAGSAQGENQKNELLSIMEIVPFRIKLMSITWILELLRMLLL